MTILPIEPASSHIAEPFDTVVGVDQNNVGLLADGSYVGALVEPDLIPPEMLPQITAELDAVDDWALYSQVSPPVPRLFPAAYSFMTEWGGLDWVGYTAERKRAEQQLYRMPQLALAVQMLISHVATALQMPVMPATCNGRPMAPFILRDMTLGNPMHYDWATREARHMLDQIFPTQLSFLITLEQPKKGGECVVYDHQFHPRDAAVNSTFIHESVIADDRSISLAPLPGTLYAFKTMNLHKVLASTGGRRTTISFFLGLDPFSNVLRIWA